jgi:iron-sulfur cluster assembly accessory protein
MDGNAPAGLARWHCTKADNVRNTHRSSSMTVSGSTETTTNLTSVPQPSGIILTDTAAGKVKSLLEQEGRDDLSLRVAVQPGGCSGLRYQLFFDERSLDGDIVKDFSGVQVVTDRMSAPYLGGATIDFVDTIEKQGFTIDNPNASGSCACGDSFH